MRWVSLVIVGVLAGQARADPPVDFLPEAKELLVVGACANGVSAHVKRELVAAHCKRVRAAQAEYQRSWIAIARPFFARHVPAGLPKTVVYPFAGGDLSTALTVYPDADEITTLALEPAGDARALGRLSAPELVRALAVVATELEALYRSNFSKTMNMINAMRGGALPTQLIFSLSALHLHGYVPVSVRYFRLDRRGAVVYLTADDVRRYDRIRDVGAHNRAFGNVEIRFRKRGSRHLQVYRHIVANLDNAHLAKWPAPLRHLEKKGRVAAMTKAASYLLSFGDFSRIRTYLLRHVAWMVSDTTGVPPSYGTPAGFEYETWGEWASSNMAAGNGAVRKTWKTLFAARPHRALAFRFGYPNGQGGGHLVFMKRGAARAVKTAKAAKRSRPARPVKSAKPIKSVKPIKPAKPVKPGHARR